MRKKRGYKRDTPLELLRDYKLFAIACEGRKREPEYLKLFEFLSPKVKVDLIEEIVPENAMESAGTKSSPNWVLDRAVKYIEQEGLDKEDDLWFVMDVDRWKPEQLRLIAEHCQHYPNWHIAISNPCFEVWLYFHFRKEFPKTGMETCKELKFEISTLTKGGYHPIKFLQEIDTAIKHAKRQDSDPTHFFPKLRETKIYQLVESMKSIAGENAWQAFLKKLTEL